jgi:hypothetical protein
MKLNQPMQPIELVDGQPRFKANKIVKFLLEAGPFDLNQISAMPFENEDYTHLMQLIGYSVDGYGELSTSPRDLVERAYGYAEELVRVSKQDEPA